MNIWCIQLDKYTLRQVSRDLKDKKFPPCMTYLFNLQAARLFDHYSALTSGVTGFVGWVFDKNPESLTVKVVSSESIKQWCVDNPNRISSPEYWEFISNLDCDFDHSDHNISINLSAFINSIMLFSKTTDVNVVYKKNCIHIIFK